MLEQREEQEEILSERENTSENEEEIDNRTEEHMQEDILGEQANDSDPEYDIPLSRLKEKLLSAKPKKMFWRKAERYFF